MFCGPYVYVTSDNHSYDDPARAHRPAVAAHPPPSRSARELARRGRGDPARGAAGPQRRRRGRAVVRGEVPDHAVVAGAPARVIRRWAPEDGWQPPLRTPAPVPIPDGMTAEQLLALAEAEPEAGAS